MTHAHVINASEEKRERGLGFYMHFICNIFYCALVISIQRYSHSVRRGETRAAHSLR